MTAEDQFRAVLPKQRPQFCPVGQAASAAEQPLHRRVVQKHYAKERLPLELDKNLPQTLKLGSADCARSQVRGTWPGRVQADQHHAAPLLHQREEGIQLGRVVRISQGCITFQPGQKQAPVVLLRRGHILIVIAENKAAPGRILQAFQPGARCSKFSGQAQMA